MAEIIVKCKHCNVELSAPEELIGKEVRCYNCQTLQKISPPELNIDSSPSPENQADPEAVSPPVFAPMLDLNLEEELEMPGQTDQEQPVETEIIFKCVGCKSILAAPYEHIGYNVRCDECNTKMPVPQKSNASLEDEKETNSPPEKEAVKPEEPTPIQEPETTIAKSPFAEENQFIPKLKPPAQQKGMEIPKAPIAIDDDNDDNIPKLRPPPKRK